MDLVSDEIAVGPQAMIAWLGAAVVVAAAADLSTVGGLSLTGQQAYERLGVVVVEGDRL